MPYIGRQNNVANSKIKKYSFTVSSATQQNFSVIIGSTDEVQVFLNGALLQDTVDYNASSTQVSLTNNAVQNDILDVHIYQSFVVADAPTTATLNSTAQAKAISMSIALGG